MTSRTSSPNGRPAGRRRASAKKQPAKKQSAKKPPAKKAIAQQPPERSGWKSTSPGLRIGLALSVLGAALAYAGVESGLVTNEPASGFASSPLLLIVAFAPPVLAIAFIQSGRAPVATGVLTGAGLLAPGLALIDAQLLHDALRASRPELFVPTSLAPLPSAIGSWLLLAGHVATAAAGLLAGADKAKEQEISTAARSRAMGAALACVTVSVVGLLMQPFRSDNAFLPATDLIASPLFVRIGGFLLVLTLVIGGVVAAGGPRPALARGAALGLLAALSWLALPQLVAVMSIDWLHLETGAPLLTLLPLCLLALLLFAVPSLSRGDRAELKEGELPPDLHVTASPAHLVTGVLGVLTGAAALVGAFGTQFVVGSGFDAPESYANRQLIPAGALLIVLSATLFTRWSGTVRPALVVALASVGLVGLSALDAVFTGTSATDEIRVGAGAWFTGIALVLAAVTACAAAVAGGAERDDVDMTESTVHIRVVIPLVAAVLLAVGAFGLPMLTAPDFVAPGIWTEFRLASWGLVIALAVVLVVAVIASMARPARATALLLGAASVVGVHLLELPMTGARAPGATAGTGTWLSLACVVTLVIAAVVAATNRKAVR